MSLLWVQAQLLSTLHHAAQFFATPKLQEARSHLRWSMPASSRRGRSYSSTKPETLNIVILKPYPVYHKEYQEKINELKANDFHPDKYIIGEVSQKLFIRIFVKLLRLKNILSAFDDFDDNRSGRDFHDYQSRYLNLCHDFRGQSTC